MEKPPSLVPQSTEQERWESGAERGHNQEKDKNAALIDFLREIDECYSFLTAKESRAKKGRGGKVPRTMQTKLLAAKYLFQKLSGVSDPASAIKDRQAYTDYVQKERAVFSHLDRELLAGDMEEMIEVSHLQTEVSEEELEELGAITNTENQLHQKNGRVEFGPQEKKFYDKETVPLSENAKAALGILRWKGEQLSEELEKEKGYGIFKMIKQKCSDVAKGAKISLLTALGIFTVTSSASTNELWPEITEAQKSTMSKDNFTFDEDTAVADKKTEEVKIEKKAEEPPENIVSKIVVGRYSSAEHEALGLIRLHSKELGCRKSQAAKILENYLVKHPKKIREIRKSITRGGEILEISINQETKKFDLSLHGGGLHEPHLHNAEPKHSTPTDFSAPEHKKPQTDIHLKTSAPKHSKGNTLLDMNDFPLPDMPEHVKGEQDPEESLIPQMASNKNMEIGSGKQGGNAGQKRYNK